MTPVVMINLALIWFLLLINTVIVAAVVRRLRDQASQDAPKGTIEPGRRAPEFRAEALQGGEVSRDDFVGRALVLLFVSPTCAPCKEALPEYNRLRPFAKQAGVELVLVSLAELEPTRLLAREISSDFLVLAAPRHNNSFAEDYELPGTPSFCVIDTSGIIESSGYPSPNYGPWKELVTSWGSSSTTVGDDRKEARESLTRR